MGKIQGQDVNWGLAGPPRYGGECAAPKALTGQIYCSPMYSMYSTYVLAGTS